MRSFPPISVNKFRRKSTATFNRFLFFEIRDMEIGTAACMYMCMHTFFFVRIALLYVDKKKCAAVRDFELATKLILSRLTSYYMTACR
jgi:hypothetical protein